MHNPLFLGAAIVLLCAPFATAKIPLFFEQNSGQTDARVDFIARGGGYVLFLNDGEAVLKLKNRSVHMRLPGANGDVPAVGLARQSGRSSYLRTGDGSRNVTGIAQYAKVRYNGVYPGIDVVYYGKDGQLEYDFVVSPSADPSQIRLRFDGATSVRLDASGNLLVGDDVRFERPKLYQDVSGQRVEVSGSFRLRENEATFDVGAYRSDLPLVIDPVLTYSTYVGGIGDDQIRAIAVDAAGNAYIGGETTSADFPVTPGAYDGLLASQDIFIAKLNVTGSALVYATYIGLQDEADFLRDIDVTPDGRVVAIGSSSLPATAGAFSATTQCCNSDVVLRLNSNGTALEYVSRPGFNAVAVKVLADDSIVMGGPVRQDLLLTTPNAYKRSASIKYYSGIPQVEDSYVLKLNPAGSTPVFATYLGRPFLVDMGVDTNGDIYVVSAYIDTAGNQPLYHRSNFAMKLKSDGTALVYQKELSGTPYRLAPGPLGDLWVVGVKNAPYTNPCGSVYFDCASFLLRLNATGTQEVFSTFSPTVRDAAMDIAVKADGDAFVVGSMTGPVTSNAFQQSPGGIYIRQFDPSGSIIKYATYHGGGSATVGGVALDGLGSLYVAGFSTASNMPTTNGSLQRTFKGGSEGFVAKISAGVVSCSYAIATTSASFSAAPGTGTVSVSATNGCSWIASTSSDWITLLSLSAGNGSGTLAYTIGENKGEFPRTGIITVAGESLTISQVASPCSYTIAPTSRIFDAAGGSSNIAVAAPQGCSWAVTSNVSWIIPVSTGGSGSGVVAYTVARNGGGVRTGTMTIAGKTVSISQNGVCPLSLSPKSIVFGIEGGISNFAVTANPGCTWAVLSNATWIKPVTTTNGASTKEYIVDPNTGAARAGIVTVGAQTLAVMQSGLGCSSAIVGSSQDVSATGSTYFLYLATSPSCAWTVTSNAPWISITSGAVGSGSAGVQFAVADNMGPQRQGTITVGEQTFTVTQAASTACTSTALPSILNIPSQGGLYAVDITAVTGCMWTASSSGSWITVAPTSGSGSGSVKVTVGVNTGAARNASILIGSQTVRITQQGTGGCTYTLGANAAPTTASGLSSTFTVTAGSACPWTATSDKNWVQVYPLSGVGTATASYIVFPNFTASSRTGTINVMGQPLTITQAAATGTPEERFIGEMYFASFGRVAAPNEVAAHLAANRGRPELVNIFLNVPEFTNGAKFVAGLYVGILGRDAEYGGWMFQRNAMAQYGATPHGLVGNFLNSTEFTSKYGLLTNADFVRLLYRQVLGREASQAEVTFQVTNLKTRVDLAVAFLTSDEYKVRVGPRLTGFLLHALLLQRDPTQDELDTRAAQIAAGTPLTTIISQILPTL